MSATTRGTAADRVWAAFIPRPSALRRPSDRVETLARWVALTVLVVFVPFLLAFGSGRAQDMRDAAAAARASSHPITATVTRVDLRAASAGGMSAGGVDVTATWTAPDGTVHTATGCPTGAPGSGTRGRPGSTRRAVRWPPPADESEAVTQGVLLALRRCARCWSTSHPRPGRPGALASRRPHPRPALRVFHESAVRAAREIVASVVEDLRAELVPMPEIEVDALPGRPVDVLVDEAGRAEALVVGHRGRGAVASAFLGSTSLGCVLHAPCPVTVVPLPGAA